MTDRDNLSDNLETIDNLIEGLSCDRKDDIKTLRESLIEYNIDPDQVLEKGLKLFSTFKNRQRRIQSRKRLNTFKEIIQDFIKGNLQFTLDRKEELARKLSGEMSGVRYQAYYRKLENIKDKDLQSLDDDAKLLEFWNEFEKL